MNADNGTIPVLSGPTTTVNADNPWPGLVTYSEAEQRYFQGRNEETDELFRMVMRARLTVLFGLSGLGKSSLLQAGLFPVLRQETILPVYIRFDFLAPEPNLINQVRAALAHQAASAGIETPASLPEETLWEYFHRRGHEFWNARNRPVMPLLVFDQFEEVFTLGRLDPARSASTEEFIQQLADLSEGRPPTSLKAVLDDQPDEAKAFTFAQHNYKILLSLREDFLPELETLRLRMPSLALNRFRLRRMTGEAALPVLNQASHLIDADVAEEVVRFVAADPGRLPLADLEIEPALLSVVCRELNDKRQAKGLARITADLLEGNRDRVLTEFYERSVSDLSQDVRQFIEDHLLTRSGFRDSIAEDNAINEPGVTRQVIDQLVERRLIRREARGGIQRLELIHDRLCGVVRASRNARSQIEAVERARQALLEAQDVEKRRRYERDLQRTKAALVVFGVFLLITVAALVWAVRQRAIAEGAMQKASAALTAEQEAKKEAEGQRQRAEEATKMIKQGLVIRQTALSGHDQDLRQLLSSLDRTTSIRFQASEQYLGYKNENGQKIYRFGLFPEPTTLPTGQEAVAFITYLADHTTFQNTLMIAGPGRNFRVSYTGWGCLTRIIALVEYQDPSKTPTVAEFNMCKTLGW